MHRHAHNQSHQTYEDGVVIYWCPSCGKDAVLAGAGLYRLVEDKEAITIAQRMLQKFGQALNMEVPGVTEVLERAAQVQKGVGGGAGKGRGLACAAD
jgi:hypothetical protein